MIHLFSIRIRNSVAQNLMFSELQIEEYKLVRIQKDKIELLHFFLKHCLDDIRDPDPVMIPKTSKAMSDTESNLVPDRSRLCLPKIRHRKSRQSNEYRNDVGQFVKLAIDMNDF